MEPAAFVEMPSTPLNIDRPDAVHGTPPRMAGHFDTDASALFGGRTVGAPNLLEGVTKFSSKKILIVSVIATIGALSAGHLDAEIGFITILLHHPHLHCMVPGGGLSPEGRRWIANRLGFFLSKPVLSRLFRRLFLAQLRDAFDHRTLQFFNAEAVRRMDKRGRRALLMQLPNSMAGSPNRPSATRVRAAVDPTVRELGCQRRFDPGPGQSCGQHPAGAAPRLSCRRLQKSTSK